MPNLYDWIDNATSSEIPAAAAVHAVCSPTKFPDFYNINANLREEGNMYISYRRYRNEASEAIERAKGNVIDDLHRTMTTRYN